MYITNVGFCAIGIDMRSYFVHRNSKLLVKSLDCAEPLKHSDGLLKTPYF
jgi:hypothetical protein